MTKPKRERPPQTWDPAPDGLVLVDKPAGITSHDVVSRLRYLARTTKVGHAGTLDPMATGLLTLGIGKATKLLTYLVGHTKQYEATIRLGIGTLTDDAEGEITTTPGAAQVDLESIFTALEGLRGQIWQVPSAVSAIKINGVRAYTKARAGETVELAARQVTVSRFDVLEHRFHTGPDGVPVCDLEVVVDCSSGTYIRALARDLGAALGTAGHLTRLRRTLVGDFNVQAALDLEQLQEQTSRSGVLAVTPLADAVQAMFTTRQLSAAECEDVQHGRFITANPDSTVIGGLAPDGRAIALLENRVFQDQLVARPIIVFETADAGARPEPVSPDGEVDVQNLGAQA